MFHAIGSPRTQWNLYAKQCILIQAGKEEMLEFGNLFYGS